jgi:hypothetical protein
MANHEQLLDTIGNMTVLELAELKKKYEDKFGVTAAAPMMAMPMGGGAGGAGAAVEAEARAARPSRAPREGRPARRPPAARPRVERCPDLGREIVDEGAVLRAARLAGGRGRPFPGAQRRLGVCGVGAQLAESAVPGHQRLDRQPPFREPTDGGEGVLVHPASLSPPASRGRPDDAPPKRIAKP